MTNTFARQVAVTSNNVLKMSATENFLTGEKATGKGEKKAHSSSAKVAAPKRYSFDDNGGGYRGL